MKQMDRLLKKNGNKYLIFTDTDKDKEVLEKYSKLCNELKYQIKAISSDIWGHLGQLGAG